MAKTDLEVKEILDDIRHRVFAEHGVESDGALDLYVDGAAASTRIEAYLTATDRLRTSLPPVTTYRSGSVAKLELWIKGKLRRAMRWIVLDQINFNSTVQQILSELHAVQVRQERMLQALHDNETGKGFNDEQAGMNTELRVQMNETAVVIDRLRRNFEHRLRAIEQASLKPENEPREPRGLAG